MVILENIDIDIDIDKAILQNIDIDKISNRFKFGISNRAKYATLQMYMNHQPAIMKRTTAQDKMVKLFLKCIHCSQS